MPNVQLVNYIVIIVKMREALERLLSRTLGIKFNLPYNRCNIPRSMHSTEDDYCFSVIGNEDDIARVIYNGIVEYSYDKWEISLPELNLQQIKALKTKIRFDEKAKNVVQIKYGFYGEILLYLILEHFFKADTLTARGRFCNILERSETKGYDTYQLRNDTVNNCLELWFGEVKFYVDYKQSINKVFENIDKALSDEYLSCNLIAIFDKADYSHLDKNIKSLKDSWEQNPDINIAVEAKKNNIILVYPIILIFNEKKCPYEDLIKEVISYIDNKNLSPSLKIKYKLFFVILPVKDGVNIKKQVLSWISKREPLI
jgi:hypothetical protein